MLRKKFDPKNLLQELQKENVAAIEYFFKEHHQVMCQYAYDLIDDNDKADIIYSDVILHHLIPGIARFTSIEEVKAFCYDAINEACRQFLQERDGETTRLAEYFNATEKIEHPEDLMWIRMGAEILQEMHDKIDSLPDTHRYVCTLLYLHSMKNKDVADFLDISPQEVNRLKNECIKRLRCVFEVRQIYQQHYWLILQSNRFKDFGFDTEYKP